MVLWVRWDGTSPRGCGDQGEVIAILASLLKLFEAVASDSTVKIDRLRRQFVWRECLCARSAPSLAPLPPIDHPSHGRHWTEVPGLNCDGSRTLHRTPMIAR
jgi:hypothetical protein